MGIDCSINMRTLHNNKCFFFLEYIVVFLKNEDINTLILTLWTIWTYTVNQ